MSNKHTFLVSDESVNSYGFKVLTNGIDTTRFETNPIMLYMHERPHIIGKWENIRKENGQLFADAIFDHEDPTAKEIAGKVERGFLKCASIGIGRTNLADGVVSTCELFEISIVDIGSNGNALRLYTDTESTIQLKLNEISISDSLTAVLNSPGATQTQVLEKVKDLLTLNKEYKTKLDSVATAQEQEAIYLVDEAINRGLIKVNYRDNHLRLFKEDFNKARIELADLFPFKRVSFLELIDKANLKNKHVNKSDWTLDDYRKLAPLELEANPELFKNLLEKQKSN